MEETIKKLLWKSNGYGFFAGATAMAIISIIVITIQNLSRSCG